MRVRLSGRKCFDRWAQTALASSRPVGTLPSAGVRSEGVEKDTNIEMLGIKQDQLQLNTPYKNFPRRGGLAVPHSGATPDSTTKDYTNDKYCWKVWIHRNRYSRLAQEPWIESPCNGRRSLPEISTDGCQNRNPMPLDLDGGSHVS
ncbi:hypothetical protein AVEN_140268-1 [Araneus ventricosus]|uniref:Uncharacterized protein n=1 Tax=Araneus ventricosus TaxID=182803 RepID=A0A4Y2T944_ARAVE|nr:hypothetical protein AVEN_140268-1 [Araneus ventricosus]